MGEYDVVLNFDQPGRCSFSLPFDPKAEYGRSRTPVIITIPGHPRFATAVFSHDGTGLVALRSNQITEMGLIPGQRVTVTVALDPSTRSVDVPPDLTALLALDGDALATYESLSYDHQLGFVHWIEGADQDEARARRLSQTIELLRDGVRTPCE